MMTGAGRTCRWPDPGRVTGAPHRGDALHLVELVRVTGEEPDFEWRAALTENLATARDPLGGWARPGAELKTTAVAVRLIVLAGVRESARTRSPVSCAAARTRPSACALVPAPGRPRRVHCGTGSNSRALGLTLSYTRAIAQSLALLQRPYGGLGARHGAIATRRETWLALPAAQLLEQIQEERR